MAATTNAAPLRAYHRTSALIAGGFLLLHMGNHAVGLFGQTAHIAAMGLIRPLYRNAVVEPILLVLLTFQIVSGLAMVIKGWRNRNGLVAWLQALSGLYLAAFLAIHVTSVLAGRWQLGLDTNFNFAAAGFHVAAWPFYFAPYYFFAVAALFTHVGCALYWNLGTGRGSVPRRTMIAFTAGGAMFALAITLALGGALFPVTIPDRYLATYQR
jgi:hypothetical protein